MLYNDFNDFPASVERQGYRMALMACGQREEALDMLQDAMLKMATSYADKPKEQWRPLFFRAAKPYYRLASPPAGERSLARDAR